MGCLMFTYYNSVNQIYREWVTAKLLAKLETHGQCKVQGNVNCVIFETKEQTLVHLTLFL